jgi:hypothetical protein
MPLLLEYNPTSIFQEGRRIYLEGVVATADKRSGNLNGRIYPGKVLHPVMQKAQGKVARGQLVGTLGHSDHNTSATNPEKISHIFKNLMRKHNQWHGRAMVLNEGAGRILSEIIKCSGPGSSTLGFSTRGSGSLVTLPSGLSEVASDYQLFSVDCVHEPSNGEESFVRAVCESIAGDTLDSQEINTALQVLASSDPMAIIRAVGLENYQAIVQAQLANAIDVDQTVARYIHNKNDATHLQRLEADRIRTLEKLMRLQTEINNYTIQNPGLNKNTVQAYADRISKESNPIKKASLQKEAQAELYGQNLIKESVRLLSRIARTPHDYDTTVQESLQNRAGTRQFNLNNELDAVNRMRGKR